MHYNGGKRERWDWGLMGGLNTMRKNHSTPHHTTLDQGISYLIWLLTRKDDGLIVALSDNLERPIVGQSGTFVEPGSANLISFQVEES